MHAFVVLLVVFNALLPSVSSDRGVDVSSSVTQSEFSCLKSNGVADFVIVRAYQSLGHVDSNAPQTIANAKAAGIEFVDVYMFPCPRCNKNASTQVEEMVNFLGNTIYGQIWLDIELASQYWLGSYSENQQFFEDMLHTASNYIETGVYTSQSQWNSIMGMNYTGGLGHLLWYAHHDSNPSFSDFVSFGGWLVPAMKQYEGNKTSCGAGIDLNYSKY